MPSEKISQLAALYSTTDKMINEINFELSNPNFMKPLKEAVDLIHSAQSSITDLTQVFGLREVGDRRLCCPNILVLPLIRLLLNTGTHTYQLFLFKINFQSQFFWNKKVRFGKELWRVC